MIFGDLLSPKTKTTGTVDLHCESMSYKIMSKMKKVSSK